MSGQNADSSHRNEQPQSTNKKRGWKICQNCNQFSPPAAKICKYEGCKAMFPSKQFNWSEIDNMGMTNPTHQRGLLEKRANILYKKHKWDVVVLYYHPHGKGDTVSFYGTPGVAAKFLGLSPSQEKMPPAGKGALDLFERFIDREVKEPCTTPDVGVTAAPASTTPNVTTTSFPLPAVNNLSSQISSLSHSSLPSLSNASSSLSAQSVSTSYTNQPSSTGPVSLPSTTNVSSSPSAPSATTVTTNVSSANPFISQSSSTEPISLPSTTNVSSSASTPSSVSSSSSSSGTEPVLSQRSSEKRIAYVCKNTVKALGLPFESRNVLHGHTIPEGSICVQITETCAPNIPAPLVLGHVEDNCFLRSGMFFALPKRHLFNYVFNKNTNRVQLFPYSSGV